MIAYEIQLRYVIRDKIRDKIQSDTKFSLRQIFFCQKKILSEKKLSQILSQTEFCLGHYLEFSSVFFFELSRTNQCLSIKVLSIMFIILVNYSVT